MNPRPKILMLTTQLGYGGAETSFIRLANFLAQTMDVTVALFTSDYGAGAYNKGHEPLSASIVLLDRVGAPRAKRWLRRITGLRKLKAQHDATISFLSGPNLVNVLAGHNRRTIVSLRGSRHYDPVAPRMQRSLFRYLLDPIIFHLAAHIVPVSPGLRYEIGGGKARQKKITPISPFIETASIAGRLTAPLPENFEALRGQKIIVAVGRLSVEKGFQHLIRVFAKLAARQPGTKLLLVGDGPMMEALRAQCHALGLAIDDYSAGVTAVIFAGYQARVLPLMALGTLYAMTSATEGFPSVLLESMAAGVLVIAADTPWGVRSILSDDAPTANPYPTTQATETPYGVLMPRIDAPEYEPAWVEALQHYLNAPPHNGQKAHARVAEYDIARIGAKWRQLLETVVSP